MNLYLRLKRLLAGCLVFAFLGNFLVVPPVYAQELTLPQPGIRVALSPAFNPLILKGLKVHPDNPFRLEFILDKGDEKGTDANSALRPVVGQELGSVPKNESLKQESTRLIKYFLASLTVPEKDLWVNLSPYEKDRIVPQSFGMTEMGRDLLAQDYLLKQITASLIYPEDEFGKKFWKRVYEEAAKKFGTTNIPVNTFNKVWIVPEKAVVYENAQAGTAYVVESKLKVMLEEDYLAVEKNRSQSGDMLRKPEGIATCPQAGCQAKQELTTKATQRNAPNAFASQIVREIVIPQLTKEINENKNFAQLRQVYNSLILATWYKKKIKDSILNKVYADKNKVSGLSPTWGHVAEASAKAEDRNVSPSTLPSDQPSNVKATQVNNSSDDQALDVQDIYNQYLQAFKKGVYNYIKEEQDPLTQQIVPRKYFSGGFFGAAIDSAMSTTTDAAMINYLPNHAFAVQADIRPDMAMEVDPRSETINWENEADRVKAFERLKGLKDRELMYGLQWGRFLSKDRKEIYLVLKKVLGDLPQAERVAQTLARMQEGSLEILMITGVLTPEEKDILNAGNAQALRNLSQQRKNNLRERIRKLVESYEKQLTVDQRKRLMKRLVPLSVVKLLGDYYKVGQLMLFIISGHPDFPVWFPRAYKKVNEIEGQVGGEHNAWAIMLAQGLNNVDQWIEKAKIEIGQTSGNLAFVWREKINSGLTDVQSDTAMTNKDQAQMSRRNAIKLISAPVLAGLPEAIQYKKPRSKPQEVYLYGFVHLTGNDNEILQKNLYSSESNTRKDRARRLQAYLRNMRGTLDMMRRQYNDIRRILKDHPEIHALGVEFEKASKGFGISLHHPNINILINSVQETRKIVEDLFQGYSQAEIEEIWDDLLLVRYGTNYLYYKFPDELRDISVFPIEAEDLKTKQLKLDDELRASWTYFNRFEVAAMVPRKDLEEIDVFYTKVLNAGMSKDDWNALGRLREKLKLYLENNHDPNINEFMRQMDKFRFVAEEFLQPDIRSQAMGVRISKYGENVLVLLGAGHVREVKGMLEKLDPSVKVSSRMPPGFNDKAQLAKDVRAAARPDMAMANIRVFRKIEDILNAKNISRGVLMIDGSSGSGKNFLGELMQKHGIDGFDSHEIGLIDTDDYLPRHDFIHGSPVIRLPDGQLIPDQGGDMIRYFAFDQFKSKVEEDMDKYKLVVVVGMHAPLFFRVSKAHSPDARIRLNTDINIARMRVVRRDGTPENFAASLKDAQRMQNQLPDVPIDLVIENNETWTPESHLNMHSPTSFQFVLPNIYGAMHEERAYDISSSSEFEALSGVIEEQAKSAKLSDLNGGTHAYASSEIEFFIGTIFRVLRHLVAIGEQHVIVTLRRYSKGLEIVVEGEKEEMPVGTSSVNGSSHVPVSARGSEFMAIGKGGRYVRTFGQRWDDSWVPASGVRYVLAMPSERTLDMAMAAPQPVSKKMVEQFFSLYMDKDGHEIPSRYPVFVVYSPAERTEKIKHSDKVEIRDIKKLWEGGWIDALPSNSHFQFVWTPGKRDEWAQKTGVLLEQEIQIPVDEDPTIHFVGTVVIRTGGYSYKVWVDEKQQIKMQALGDAQQSLKDSIDIPWGKYHFKSQKKFSGNAIKQKKLSNFSFAVNKGRRGEYSLHFRNYTLSEATLNWSSRPMVAFDYQGVHETGNTGKSNEVFGFVDTAKGVFALTGGAKTTAGIVAETMRSVMSNPRFSGSREDLLYLLEENLEQARKQVQDYYVEHGGAAQDGVSASWAVIRQRARRETGELIGFNAGNNLFLRRVNGDVDVTLGGPEEAGPLGERVQTGETIIEAFTRSVNPGEIVVAVSPGFLDRKVVRRIIAQYNDPQEISNQLREEAKKVADEAGKINNMTVAVLKITTDKAMTTATAISTAIDLQVLAREGFNVMDMPDVHRTIQNLYEDKRILAQLEEFRQSETYVSNLKDLDRWGRLMELSGPVVYYPFGGIDLPTPFGMVQGATDIVAMGLESFGTPRNIKAFLTQPVDIRTNGLNTVTFDPGSGLEEIMNRYGGIGPLIIAKAIALMGARITKISYFDLDKKGSIQLLDEHQIKALSKENRASAMVEFEVEDKDSEKKILKRFWYLQQNVYEEDPRYKRFINDLSFQTLFIKGGFDFWDPEVSRHGKPVAEVTLFPARKNHARVVSDRRMKGIQLARGIWAQNSQVYRLQRGEWFGYSKWGDEIYYGPAEWLKGPKDFAMAGEDVGGIDLTSDKMPLEVKMDSRLRGNDSAGIKFNIDPAMMQQLQNAPGFMPVIINIAPIQDLRIFLGITSPQAPAVNSV